MDATDFFLVPEDENDRLNDKDDEPPLIIGFRPPWPEMLELRDDDGGNSCDSEWGGSRTSTCIVSSSIGRGILWES